MLNDQQNDSRSEDQAEENYFYSDTGSGGELEIEHDKIGVSDFQTIEPSKVGEDAARQAALQCQ